MHAMAIIKSTFAGSLVYSTPLTPSKINIYWHMLSEVAISPFNHGFVNELLAKTAKIIPPASLGRCKFHLPTMYLT